MTNKTATPAIEAQATVTPQQMAGILGATKGATIISLSWVSTPARRVADKGRIRKISRYSAMINPRYDRKKAKAAGIPLSEVEVVTPPWKDHVAGPVYTHNGYRKDRKTGEIFYDSPKKGTLYLEFYPQSGSTTFELDGTPCQREDVVELIPKSYPAKEGEVENYRTIGADSLTQVVITQEKGPKKTRTTYTVEG